MRERAQELCDRTVWVLARLSLTMLLALMGALFIGSAAEGDTSADSSSVVATQAAEPETNDAHEDATPLGTLLVAVIMTGGLGVLAVGAARPHRRSDSRELAELLRD